MAELHPYPKAYVEYLAEFHGTRDFFECHEIMEEYWLTQKGTRHEICWLVFIRIPVACYHARRGNWAGARIMMAKAAAEIDPVRMSELGMDGEKLADLVRRLSDCWTVSDRPVYRDFDLPIADARLQAESMRLCREKGWEWGISSERIDEAVIHRHLTRDRTAVVEARRLSAERKRKERES